MKTLVTTFLCVLSLCLGSCKKDRRTQPENLLIGDWRQTEDNHLIRSFKFSKDLSFSLSVGRVYDTSTMYKGTYQIKGDSLKITTTELIVQEPGKAAQWIAAPYQLYEKATFKISDNRLTLNYITYPADGPVPTTAIFGRMIRID